MEKIDQLSALLQTDDPECDNFDQAFAIMMDLKSQIPSLPDEQRHDYAAKVAMKFEQMLMAGLEEEDN